MRGTDRALFAHMEQEMDPKYLTRIPASPAGIPPGLVVVHNHVRPARVVLGTRGFRAWLAAMSDAIAACNCGWAPELQIHYCVNRVSIRGGIDALTGRETGGEGELPPA